MECSRKRLLGASVIVSTTLLPIQLHAAAAEEIRILRGTLQQSLHVTVHLNLQGTSGVRIEAALLSG